MPGASGIVLYGAAYSVYVRAVRLALEEKGLDYRLEEIDIFAPETLPAGYARRHPFGKIPAFEHEGLALYESDAILRYIEERFPRPALLPEAIAPRARANQLLAVLNNYAYRALVWDIYVERCVLPQERGAADEAKIDAALPAARRCLGALEDLTADAAFLLVERPLLPDLLAYPILRLFRAAPEGTRMLLDYPRLAAAHTAMAARPSAQATRFPVEGEG
ncbi:MAG: glutathione S-transferase family protein [Rhodovibrionaceae bacterium]